MSKLGIEIQSTENIEPLYLRIAHWIYEQRRMISAREVVELWGGSPWAMEQIFSTIRLQTEIILSEEKVVPCKGGKKYLIRVIYIYPYTLDISNIPRRKIELYRGRNVPLGWKDLICRKWSTLISIQKDHVE